MTTTTTRAADALARALRAETAALWDMLHRAVVLRLLLAGERQQFLGEAVDELEAASDRLRLVEVGRAAHAEALAAELGLGPQASLRELLAALDAPDAALLEPVASELATLHAEVSAACADSTGRAERELALQRRSLEQLVSVAAVAG